MSTVIEEIAAERARQMGAEGWSAEHDDEHSNGALAAAAATYAAHAALASRDGADTTLGREAVFGWWPWDWSWWKPTNRRRDLVKAGALIVAEIERLDRAAQRALLQKERGS